MSAAQSPLSLMLTLFCLPLLGALTAGLLGLSFPAGLLPVALTAGIGAWLGLRFRQPSATNPAPQVALKPTESLASNAVPPAMPAQRSDSTAAPAVPEADPKLRHDLRNILSPAMLAAEQLGTSTDPLVLRAARTIDESLDRALIRLKQKTQS